MKRFIFSFYLVWCFVCSIYAVSYVYISDCGRKFYYYNNRSNWGSRTPKTDRPTDEDFKYASAQSFGAEKTVDVNYDRDQLRREVREEIRKEVYKVYRENCAYMAQNFNVHYTFDKIYEILSHFFDGITYIDDEECTFIMWVLTYNDFLLYQDKIEKYNKDHPYWLGYLYKEVKYDENGNRLKEPTDVIYK